MLRQHLVDRRDREDPVDGVVQRLLRVDVLRPCLQPQERRDRLQVVLDAVVDLLREHTAHHRPPVFERDRRVMRDRFEQRFVVGRERDVAVADELADLPALPAQRHASGVRARTAFRPRDLAVLQYECRTRRVQRLHRRLHDRLERLLEVEGLRHGLRDARERLELGDTPLGTLVELRVLDRLRDLRRDRDKQVDLVVRERAGSARPDVERALELVGTRHDRNGEDRLVLVLGQVGELLEARIEVGLLGDHDRRALCSRDARDPLARPHPRRARELLDPCAMGRAQHEFVRPLVVEVDEAGVRPQRIGDLARDELEHLLEVERRVDRSDRLGEESKVPGGRIHGSLS